MKSCSKKTPVKEILFDKVAGLKSLLVKIDSSASVSIEYSEIFKNIYFEEHLPTAAYLINIIYFIKTLCQFTPAQNIYQRMALPN